MLRGKTARVAASGFLVFLVCIAGAAMIPAGDQGSKPAGTLAEHVLEALCLAGMSLSLTATIVGIAGWIRRGVILKSGTAGLAALGLLAFWAGALWFLIWFLIWELPAIREYPPGMLDGQAYLPPRILILAGLAILIAATIISIAGWTRRRMRVTWESINARRASSL